MSPTIHEWLKRFETLGLRPTLTNGGRPLFLKFRSSTWFITLTVSTGIFTDIFLYAVIVPVFPFSLISRVGVPEQDVQHWLSVLLAVFSVGLLVGAPICGYLADRFTYRRLPLLFGLVTVAGATLMLCLARSLPVLIVARLLQGMSSAIIWVVGLALLSDTVGSDGIATALGYAGTAYSVSNLLAPLLGGIVYNKAGYLPVFGMTFGVIVLDIILRLAIVEKKMASKWLDNPPNAEPHTGVALASDRDSEHSLGVPGQLGDRDVIGISTRDEDPGKLQIRQELLEPVTCDAVSDPRPGWRHGGRLPPIFSLWASRRLLASVFGNLVAASIVTGLDTTLTLFVSRTFGWNSLAAGVLYLAVLLPFMFSPVIGYFVDKYGARYIAAAGLVLMIPFFICMRFVTHNSLNQKVLLAAMLVGIGTGCACVFNALMAECSRVCDDKEKKHPKVFGRGKPGGAYAQAYGIFNISFATGSTVGAFWSGGIYSRAGWGTMGWSYALLCAVAAVPVLLFTDGWIGKGKRKDEEQQSKRGGENTPVEACVRR